MGSADQRTGRRGQVGHCRCHQEDEKTRVKQHSPQGATSRRQADVVQRQQDGASRGGHERVTSLRELARRPDHTRSATIADVVVEAPPRPRCTSARSRARFPRTGANDKGAQPAPCHSAERGWRLAAGGGVEGRSTKSSCGAGSPGDCGALVDGSGCLGFRPELRSCPQGSREHTPTAKLSRPAVSPRLSRDEGSLSLSTLTISLDPPRSPLPSPPPWQPFACSSPKSKRQRGA